MQGSAPVLHRLVRAAPGQPLYVPAWCRWDGKRGRPPATMAQLCKWHVNHLAKTAADRGGTTVVDVSRWCFAGPCLGGHHRTISDGSFLSPVVPLSLATPPPSACKEILRFIALPFRAEQSDIVQNSEFFLLHSIPAPTVPPRRKFFLFLHGGGFDDGHQLFFMLIPPLWMTSDLNFCDILIVYILADVIPLTRRRLEGGHEGE